MARDLIDEFRDAYSRILADAELAAETTKTDAWHAMYQRFQEYSKNEFLDIAKQLDGTAGTLRASIVDAEIVKRLGDTKKALAELCERVKAFKRDTVDPIKLPFDRANECIISFQGKAAQESDNSGMYAKDIEDRMADAIAEQPKIRWNEKIGSIQIVAAAKPS